MSCNWKVKVFWSDLMQSQLDGIITVVLMRHGQWLHAMTDYFTSHDRLLLASGWQCSPGIERCWWVGHDLVQARVGLASKTHSLPLILLISTCKGFELLLNQCAKCAKRSNSIHKM